MLLRSMLLQLTLLLSLVMLATPSHSAAPNFAAVTPAKPLLLPNDFGAHPAFRTEWWYATGWLAMPDGKPLGFQITFFRSATDHDAANPSALAPKQLIIAHVALSDPAVGKLQHDQKAGRESFDIAYAKAGNTDVKLDNWTLKRASDGSYRVDIVAREFTLALKMAPTQLPMLQGDNGISRKGPEAAQASYYYSEPHLQVSGSVTRKGETAAVSGTAWLDHEWSSTSLHPDAVGWDWVGANLDNGSALVAFRIRDKHGAVLWAHVGLRDASGKIMQFSPDQVRFTTLRNWRSLRTNAVYPVALQIQAGPFTWQILPLQDDQELDSRQSTGAIYWEGAVRLTRDGKPVGRGYLELTGYVKPLKL